MKLPYWLKLEDPRWQKKRLEILARDNFTCQKCWSTTETLHVHHRYYISKREPWDYPAFAYQTLCKKCHKEIQECAETASCRWEILLSTLGGEELFETVEAAVCEHGFLPSEVVSTIQYALPSNARDYKRIRAESSMADAFAGSSDEDMNRIAELVLKLQVGGVNALQIHAKLSELTVGFRADAEIVKTDNSEINHGQVVDTRGQSVDMNHAEKVTTNGAALNGGAHE